MATRVVICERVTGSRTLAGTEWPVSDQIVRDQRPGRRPTMEAA